MARDLWIRDAAHDHVSFEGDDAALIRSLLDCPEVQRLRRVRQLGFSSVTYPGAEHTRFAHSLGAAYVCRLALDRLQRRGLRISPRLRSAALAGALLHDVGHAPFSHATETALAGLVRDFAKHEAWTETVLTGDTCVAQVLSSRDGQFPDLVLGLVRGGPELGETQQVLHGLLSGNFDVDRLDFLVRDSVHTGLKTGLVDVTKLLEGLAVGSGSLVVQHKNLATVEEFLIARRFMYQKVYFHKTTRGMEAVYRSWLKRAQRLADEFPEEVRGTAFGRLLAKEVTTQDFLSLDDCDMIVAAKRLRDWGGDRMLTQLSEWLLCREPFKVAAEWEEGQTPVPLEKRRVAERYLEEQGYPGEYYYVEDYSSEVAYNLIPYWDDPEAQTATRIQVQTSRGVRDISTCSDVVRGLMRLSSRTRVYVPWTRRRRVQEIMG